MLRHTQKKRSALASVLVAALKREGYRVVGTVRRFFFQISRSMPTANAEGPKDAPRRDLSDAALGPAAAPRCSPSAWPRHGPGKKKKMRDVDRFRGEAVFDGVELHRADVLDAASLGAAFAGCDGVIHTASPFWFPTAQHDAMDDFIRPALDGTNNVLAAAYAAGVRNVVLTSSTGAVTPQRPSDFPGDEVGWTRPFDESDWSVDVDRRGARRTATPSASPSRRCGSSTRGTRTFTWPPSARRAR